MHNKASLVANNAETRLAFLGNSGCCINESAAAPMLGVILRLVQAAVYATRMD
ncbi:hypothetical protein D3C76_426250 [compost metagenome]